MIQTGGGTEPVSARILALSWAWCTPSPLEVTHLSRVQIFIPEIQEATVFRVLPPLPVSRFRVLGKQSRSLNDGASGQGPA